GGPLPDAPRPHAQSPYIDQTWYAAPHTASAKAFLPIVEKYLGQMRCVWPGGLDRDAMIPAVARRIVQRLALSQPATWWQEPLEQQQGELARLVTPSLIEETLGQVERSLLFGQLTVRSYDLSEDILLSPEQHERAWQIDGTGQAAFATERAGRAGG